MTRTLLDFINALPLGTTVEIRLSIGGSTSWNVGAPDVNRLILGRMASQEVEHTSVRYKADDTPITVIYPRGWRAHYGYVK